MADLEAELARFEAELASVQQAAPAQHYPGGLSNGPASSAGHFSLPAPTTGPPAQLYHAPPVLPPPSVGPPVQQMPAPGPSYLPPPSQPYMMPPPALHYQPVHPSQAMYAAPAPSSAATAHLSNYYSAPAQPTLESAPAAYVDSVSPPSLSHPTLAPPKPGGTIPMTNKPDPGQGAGGDGKGKKEKKEGMLRTAAGKRWWDPTMSEWPENDHRLFVGDLGNEATDDMLTKLFQKYPSFAKAKIVRDKRSNKTKGYGFVSFLEAVDCSKALKEMNNKYCGNRPMKLKKSDWQERNPAQKRKADGYGNANNKKHKTF